ncbi:MAPEG family protein [Sphingomonadaceae bacterium jetA1]|uniref:MAPEG family protein n=1 Tax=Facivitalis istanbulensis TaxID=3075838 RepID=UPI00346C4C53
MAARLGRHAGRAERAFANDCETCPVFIALALGLAATGKNGGLAATGAWMRFLARVACLPLYILGIRYVRSLAYLVSMVGLALTLIRFL